MRFLIPLCMCLGLSVAQQGLPSYYGGSYNIPNAPIPSPGAYGGGAPSGAYTPQASATLGSSRPQWQSPARTVQYGGGAPAAYGASPAAYRPASPSYGASPVSYAQAAPAAAPVNSIPSSYGWNVQHSSPQPTPQPQSAVIPTQYAQATPAAAPQYRPQAQYASPASAAPQYQSGQYDPSLHQSSQYNPSQYAAPAAAPARAWSPPAAPAAAPARSWSPVAAPAAAPAYQAPANPISTALARPASVHYASIGENLNGDYKFGYQTDNGFREETRAPDGTVQGQYGFTDADGKQRVVKYSAGVNGYQVLNDGSAPAASAPRAQAPAASQPAIPNWAQQSAGQWSSPQAAQAAPQQQWG